MNTQMKRAPGALAIAELKEFASFDDKAQRYIRRSLDIAFERTDVGAVWSRNALETASIRVQTRLYAQIASLRANVPDDCGHDHLIPFFGPLVRVSAFDLAQDCLPSFAAYRFLYERLFGADVRPWLPAAFCAAASMPTLRPHQRMALLSTISEAAAMAQGWSQTEPTVYPEWIDIS